MNRYFHYRHDFIGWVVLILFGFIFTFWFAAAVSCREHVDLSSLS